MKKNLLITGSLAAALVLGACSNASANDDETTQTETETAAEETPETNENIKISEMIDEDKAREAVQIAMENFDGLLEEISYSEDDGRPYYEVNLESETEEYEVELDAEDLSIIKEEREKENNKRSYSKLQDALDVEIISLEEASEKALDAVDGEIKEWSYEVDDFTYEFEILTNDPQYSDDDDEEDVEVEVNAKNGEIIEIDD